MNYSPFIILFLLLCSNNLSVFAQGKADKLLGTYRVVELETKENSKVQITKATDGTYQGQVIWLAAPNFKDGTPKTDIKNPDPKKRNTPGNKIKLMWNFSYNEKEDMWVDGEIYDPVHGKVYKCRLNFETPTKLKVRGYIGAPMFGKSMYWDKIN